MTATATLRFLAPGVPVSINDTKGQHWARTRGHLQPYRDGAWVTCRNALLRGEVPWVQGGPTPAVRVPVTIRVSIPFRTNRRRDPHNYTGTVVKAVVDGLVRAGLVPDDTPDWVSVEEPELRVIGAGDLPTVTITITERRT